MCHQKTGPLSNTVSVSLITLLNFDFLLLNSPSVLQVTRLPHEPPSSLSLTWIISLCTLKQDTLCIWCYIRTDGYKCPDSLLCPLFYSCFTCDPSRWSSISKSKVTSTHFSAKCAFSHHSQLLGFPILTTPTTGPSPRKRRKVNIVSSKWPAIASGSRRDFSTAEL